MAVESLARAAKQAVSRVRPLVVQVQPIGAVTENGSLDGLGPTSGLYLAEHRCIVTSSYRTSDAAGLLVFFEGGHRTAATLLGVDHHRKLALLRVTTPPPEPTVVTVREAPIGNLRVGQTTVAIGRVYRRDEPNLAVGVLSAKRRLFGLAVQTDAGISPANYGGPLVDLSGGVIGVLTPLTPTSGGAPGGGADWYDSGVGFAVPWREVVARLPKLLAGEDIHRGLLGLSLAPGNPYQAPATIAKLHPAGRANLAGLKVGDRIVSVDGAPTNTKTAFRFAMGGRDAADEIAIEVKRGDGTQRFSVRLVAELPRLDQPAPRGGKTRQSTEESSAATAGNARST